MKHISSGQCWTLQTFATVTMAHEAASSKGIPAKLTFFKEFYLELNKRNLDKLWDTLVTFGGIPLFKKLSGDEECNPVL